VDCRNQRKALTVLSWPAFGVGPPNGDTRPAKGQHREDAQPRYTKQNWEGKWKNTASQFSAQLFKFYSLLTYLCCCCSSISRLLIKVSENDVSHRICMYTNPSMFQFSSFLHNYKTSNAPVTSNTLTQIEHCHLVAFLYKAI